MSNLSKLRKSLPSEDVGNEIKTDLKTIVRDFFRTPWALVVLGVVLGALLVLAVRFASLKDMRVHYHANFALYVNGVRDDFNGFTYFEEVASCSEEAHHTPKTRVHLHEPNDYVVHVHDNAVTWGHLFANLGYALGNDVIKTSSGTYVDAQDGKKLQFILNGEPVPAVANRVIDDRDALLISYGNEDDAAVAKQYNGIKKDAKHFDETPDPSSCSGSEPFNTAKRFKETLKLGS